MGKLYTVRGEITKWLINEKVIRDVSVVKRWSFKQLKDFYLKIVKGMETFEGVIN
jgi:hypothetical protein